MKCPNCGVEAPGGAADCASCGIFFAKWEEKKVRARQEAAGPLASPPEPSALPRVDPMKARIVAAALVGLWVLGFGFYFRHFLVAAQTRGVRKEVRDRPIVVLRDPATGDLKQVPVVKSPTTGRKYGQSSGE